MRKLIQLGALSFLVIVCGLFIGTHLDSNAADASPSTTKSLATAPTQTAKSTTTPSITTTPTSTLKTVGTVPTIQGQQSNQNTVNKPAATSTPVPATPTPIPAPTSVTIWMQVMDSCQQALPGATFQLAGNGVTLSTNPSIGTVRVTVSAAQGQCPLQRGNCATMSVGCVSWTVDIPKTTAATYTITETVIPSGYVACDGGSACQVEVGTVTVNTNGTVSATVKNVYPDGYVVHYPYTGAAYTATPSDPIVFHDFQLGNGSCDGDGDADDHLTGTPSSHCDSDHDMPTPTPVPPTPTPIVPTPTP